MDNHQEEKMFDYMLDENGEETSDFKDAVSLHGMREVTKDELFDLMYGCGEIKFTPTTPGQVFDGEKIDYPLHDEVGHWTGPTKNIQKIYRKPTKNIQNNENNSKA